jgi:hypothetical protein
MSDSDQLPDSRLSQLLSVLGMGAYVQSFVDRGIRLEQLSTPSDGDLLELGIRSPHDRARLRDAGSVLGGRSETTRLAKVVAPSNKSSERQQLAHPILPSQRAKPVSAVRRLALSSIIVGIAATTAIIVMMQATTNTDPAVTEQGHYDEHDPDMPANLAATPSTTPEPSPPVTHIEPARITSQPPRPAGPDSPTAEPAEASEVSNPIPRGNPPPTSSAFNTGTVNFGSASDSPSHNADHLGCFRVEFLGREDQSATIAREGWSHGIQSVC